MHRWRLLLTVAVAASTFSALRAEPLPETKPLTREGDLAAQMVEGIDKYLMRELAASVEKRKQYWKPDFSSKEAYTKSVQPNRERLKQILGVVDKRVSPVVMEYVGEGTPSPLVAETESNRSYTVRWPVLPGVYGEGLLIEPKGPVFAQVIALPDADWTPEMVVGTGTRSSRRSSVCPPTGREWLSRDRAGADRSQGHLVGPSHLGRMTNQPHREFIYRMAYEMGRHIIGYEVQKVLAAVDWFAETRIIGRLAFSATAREACWHCTVPPSIRVFTVQRFVATSVRVSNCGRSRSIATSGGCCVNSAMRSFAG